MRTPRVASISMEPARNLLKKLEIEPPPVRRRWLLRGAPALPLALTLWRRSSPLAVAVAVAAAAMEAETMLALDRQLTEPRLRGPYGCSDDEGEGKWRGPAKEPVGESTSVVSRPWVPRPCPCPSRRSKLAAEAEAEEDALQPRWWPLPFSGEDGKEERRRVWMLLSRGEADREPRAARSSSERARTSTRRT